MTDQRAVTGRSRTLGFSPAWASVPRLLQPTGRRGAAGTAWVCTRAPGGWRRPRLRPSWSSSRRIPRRAPNSSHAGVLDVNGQQVDLRDKHSWTMRLGEVETPELLEVLAVNAAAPFVLNGKLRGLMERTAAANGPSEDVKGRAFVVNVSAMEGKFYRYKTANHPHTNMAKAALNMMTATAAADYASCGIYMNAVDTGWINDENPLGTAARIAKQHSFQTPIDEEDAAARCVAPVLEGIEGCCGWESTRRYRRSASSSRITGRASGSYRVGSRVKRRLVFCKVF